MQSLKVSVFRKITKGVDRTKSLTLKNVGSKAFQGTASDATVLVPKGKEKEYEEILKKRGADKKVKIKS